MVILRMSRCISYRPQAYESKDFVGEALIESIKNEKKSKKYRKEGRKLQKERMKEHKHIEHVSGFITNDKSRKTYDDNKYRQYAKVKLDFRPNGNGDESEQPEKSDITVEHEQPACSRSVFFASDNFHNSNKRKISVSSSMPAARVHETKKTGIRIRFSLKKCSEASVSINKVVSDSSANLDDRIADEVKIDGDRSRKEKICNTNTGAHIACYQIPTSSTLGDAVSSSKDGSFLEDKQYRNKIQRQKSPYLTLIEDWIPPPIQFDQDKAAGDDWLFSTKSRELHSKRQKSDKIPCYTNSCLWLEAPYLSRANLFALPYTVPF